VPLRIDCITNEPELQALQPNWNALLEASVADVVFLTWEWLSSWWSSYGKGKQLRVLVAHDDAGVCQGIAPLYIEPVRCMGRRLRRLRFLGDGSFDSDYLDFIVRPGMERQLVTAFLERMAELADVAQLNEIPAQSPTVQIIREHFEGNGFLIGSREVPCPAVALPRNWDAYLRMLRPRFRTIVRGALRETEQLPGGIERVVDEAQLEPWLSELFALHGDRWNVRNQGGVFASPVKREFYRVLSRALLSRGWLHFTRWRVQDVALAHQFGFIYRGCYFQLQEAFDPASAHLRPGISLRAAVIRQLVAAGVEKYDFLGGTGRHKTDWGTTVGTSVRFALAPRTPSGFAYVRVPELVESGKESIKSFLPAPLLNAHRRLLSQLPLSVEGKAKRRRAWRDFTAQALFRTGGMAVMRRLSRKYDLHSSPLRVVKRLGPKFVILNYHRVGTQGVPLYCKLRPEVFEWQMRFIASNYPVVSMDDLCESLHAGVGSGIGIAVTFDDGYSDTYTEALPILKKYNIPATVYLTAESIETGGLAWYDRVFLVLKHFAGDKLDLLLDRPRRFELASDRSRLLAAQSIIGFLRSCPDQRRRAICADLEAMVKLPEEEMAGRMLSWEEARDMRAAGISFGSHTMTHPVLSRLDARQRHYELAASKALIEGRLATRVEHFAFPFGKRCDYDQTGEELQSFQYRSAVTTESGANGAAARPYELKRMQTGDDESLAMFIWRLNHLLLWPCDFHEPAPAAVAARWKNNCEPQNVRID
jgi:peptidoglycan/xylan/chitin deacetylase (PgdA/CDA1 family)/CelD/BcsL family acetyltransferase involved in cellulose biosynthesis